MGLILAAIAVHVGMGATWLLATLVVAVTGWARAIWLRLLLAVAALNIVAGIYLFHTLHAGTWSSPEHWLVVGSFCAFLALGLQVPAALSLKQNERRLSQAPLVIYRLTAAILIAAASAMLASRGA